MLTKCELLSDVRNMMRAMGSLSFEVGVVQTDMYQMMAEILNDELGDDGLFRHRLKKHQEKLEIVLGWYKRLANKFKIEESHEQN
jgi:hypothetical protein